MKFSVVIPIYNEEQRIIRLLKSISGLSDDILVINKSSVDNTCAVIDSLGMPNVRVETVPFREKGDDDFRLYASHALHDWIFIMVASEIAPACYSSDLSSKLNRLDLSKYDVAMVPRLYYCFGVNVPDSPWDVSYFPFLFNRKTVIFTDVPHEHVVPRSEARRTYINLPRHAMIQHYTHTNIDSFMRSVIGYGDLEVSKEDIKDSFPAIIRSLRSIWLAEAKLKFKPGVPALMHFAAWNIHWSYQILKRGERLLAFERNNSLALTQGHKHCLRKKRFLRKRVIDGGYILFKVFFESPAKKMGVFSMLKTLAALKRK